jgi:hypothetical protein
MLYNSGCFFASGMLKYVKGKNSITICFHKYIQAHKIHCTVGRKNAHENITRNNGNIIFE